MLLLAMQLAGSQSALAEEFQPIKEAEMPKGFPAYTAVDRIEVKQYPAYRKAATSGIAEFWTLFQHIQQNKVAMTAPVEMEYGDPMIAKNKQKSMAFLYERVDQGTAGKQGRVEVTDVPAMTVVSIGCRGESTTTSIDAARGKLVKWLEEKKEDYVPDGPLRLMGYNSPFVPRDKNFFEIQIPVKAAKTRPADRTDQGGTDKGSTAK